MHPLRLIACFVAARFAPVWRTGYVVLLLLVGFWEGAGCGRAVAAPPAATSAATSAVPEQVLQIRADDRELFVEPANYSVLEDRTGRLALPDVQAPAWAARFVPATVAGTTMRQPGAAYWVRMQLQLVGNQPPQHWHLDLFDSHINAIDYYPDPADAGRRVRTGADFPFGSRPYANKNFLLRLPLEPGRVRTIYLRLQSTSKTSFLSRLRSEQGLAEHFQTEYGLLGLFYGVLLIMVVYNLCLFFFTADRAYFRYVLYVLSCSLLFLSEDGLGFQYLWPQFPQLNQFVGAVAPSLLLFTFSQYVRQFLDLAQGRPRYDIWVRGIVLSSVGLLLLDALLWQSGRGFWLYLLPYGLLFYAALTLARQGSQSARYILLAHSFVAVSVLFLVLRKLGINTFTNPYTVYSMNAALMLEVVVLSYALGDKVKTFQTATIKAQGRVVKQLRKKHAVQEQLVEQLRQNEELTVQLNTELGNLVAQRTAELQSQAETIAAQNRDLLQANALLGLQSEAIEKLNVSLQADLHRSQAARAQAQELDFGEFSQLYPDKENCLTYLAELKWANGYRCRKCNHDNYYEDREAFTRRCTRCRYVESATAYTLLQKCKFPIVKAFYAVFLLYTHKGNVSSQEFARILDLRRATCWSFSQKVVQAMARQAARRPADEGSWTQLLLDATDGDDRDAPDIGAAEGAAPNQAGTDEAP